MVKKELFLGYQLSRSEHADPDVTTNTQQFRHEVRLRLTVIHVPHATVDWSGVENDVPRYRVQEADTHRVAHPPSRMCIIVGHELADVLPHKVAGVRLFRRKDSKDVRVGPAQYKPSAQAD